MNDKEKQTILKVRKILSYLVTEKGSFALTNMKKYGKRRFEAINSDIDRINKLMDEAGFPSLEK